jgi:chemosensory pili system protein ChpC
MTSSESEGKKTIRCLLMPIQDYNLIVPHSSVDEILPFAVVEETEDSGFIIGSLQWRRESVPLVSFEVLNKSEKPELKRRTRAAVMHVNSTETAVQNFAIVLAGMPKMLVISERDLMDIDEDNLPNCTARKVDVGDVTAYIPDLDALEYILNKTVATQ